MARRRVPLSIVLASAAASLAVPAHAAPPEGCIGFPSMPDAYVCITQFTPQNAVPTVAPGPAQTYTIPEFCVFQCVGPTPVMVPSLTVTPGSGVLVRVVYKGQATDVTVPLASGPADAVALVQRTAHDAVTTVLGVVGDEGTTNTAITLLGTMRIASFGTGSSSGWLYAEATGVIDGNVRFRNGVSGSFSVYADPATCPLTWYAAGTLSGGLSGSFTWTVVGGTAVMTLSRGNGRSASGVITFAITSPVGNPCGLPVTATLLGAIAG